jgi:antitoxin component YwqK of YwqJK toxin-antitoxin module
LYEKTEWKEGIKDGLVMRYYDSGKVMMRIFFMNGIMDGEYNVYGPDEKILIQGQYDFNRRVGTWKYYKENGHIETEVKYINGVAENQAELDSLENAYIEMMEQNKGKFKEPTEEDIFR